MAIGRIARSVPLLFCCALVSAQALVVRGDEPDKQSPAKLVVEVKVVEVHMDKLKKLGFAFAQLQPDGVSVKEDSIAKLLRSAKNDPADAKQLVGFLEALRQNDLARFLTEPTLITLDGRPASLSMGGAEGGTELDIVPIVLGNGNIRLECCIRIAATQPASNRPSARKESVQPVERFRFDSAAELQPGKTTLIGHARSKQTSDGKPHETELLIFATADVVKSLPASPAGVSTTTTARELNR